MIEEFFDFDGCDFIGNYLVQHYDVVLKKQIGDIPAGTKFDCASVDFDTSKLVFFHNTGKVVATFQLGLVVLKEIK